MVYHVSLVIKLPFQVILPIVGFFKPDVLETNRLLKRVDILVHLRNRDLHPLLNRFILDLNCLHMVLEPLYFFI